MTDKKARSDQAARLRRQAEEADRKNALQPPQALESLSSEDIRKTLHELRVHQIELEMQNEELRRTQVELDASRERYFDLYNLAPVGYVTLSEQGLILEANLTAASMLGVARQTLVRQLFTRFIFEDDQNSYYLHRKKLFPQNTLHGAAHAAETPKTQAFELRLVKQDSRPAAGNSGAGEDGTPFWAQLAVTAVRAPGGALLLRVVLSDITERKRVEADLIASEQQYHDMFEANTAVKMLIDPASGAIVRANQAAAAFYGWPAPVLETMNISQVNTLSADQINVQMALAAGRDRNHFNFRHRLASGEVREVEVYASPMGSGEHKLLFSIVHDITERKQAQAALVESEERFREVLENSLDASYKRNLITNTYDYLSPVFARITGYSTEEMKALPVETVLSLTHPDDLAEIDRVIAGSLSGAAGAPYQVEYRFKHKTGEYRWLLDRFSVMRDAAGQPLARIGSMSDITRRKAVEQALHDMVIRMENIIEGTHVATYEWNVQTGETIFNETWAQFIGYTLDELAPVNIKTWERLTHADDLKRASELLERHFTGQLPYYDCEYRMKHKDGRWIWVHDRGRVFTHTHDGKPLMMFGTHTDITGRKQMEADLLQEKSLLAQKVEERTSDLRLANTELQHAARIKDEFLASMSHELRTPLTGILGLSEAFQMGIYGELNQKQVESIQNIEKSGRHLLTLINDILDLSKIGAGMITLELITVSIREVCLSSLHMVRQVANEKQIKVNLVIEEGVDYLEADARRLKQILVNLLGNAVKFSPVGSDIGLEVKGDVGNQQITFTVWDHGIGIPTRDLSRLFQVFIQLDSALSRQYGGTGLGLSLVLKMVELHGGGVRVESEPGKGSRFIVTFPWQGNPTPKADSVPLQTIGGAEVRKNIGHPIILIVEDNLLYLNLLADILAHSGYRVTKAQNGEEGIARARELKPDLILMDIQMPVLDGLQATRQIRTDPDLQKTPIIALTALAMSGDREKCIEAGMNAYLSKPVNIEELKKEMNTLIHHPSN